MRASHSTYAGNVPVLTATPGVRRSCELLEHLPTDHLRSRERPFAWCELHRRRPWSRQGRTDLADAVPLCHFHHRRVHDTGFVHASLPDWQRPVLPADLR